LKIKMFAESEKNLEITETIIKAKINLEEKNNQKLTVSSVEGWPEDIEWNEKINLEENSQKLIVSTVEGWPEDIDWE
jgi:hypothetical protein